MDMSLPPPPENLTPSEILETLTPRELDVLRLIGRGLCNKEIARLLNIKAKTVEFHASRLYKKLDVASRAGAAVWAERQGILNGFS